jgi:hypothetical protein
MACEDEVEELKRRVSRLRKSVVWLRGACHNESLHPSHTHHDPIQDCMGWECQRARAVLEEERDESAAGSDR